MPLYHHIAVLRVNRTFARDRLLETCWKPDVYWKRL